MPTRAAHATRATLYAAPYAATHPTPYSDLV